MPGSQRKDDEGDADLRARDVMQEDVLCVPEEMPIREVSDLLTRNRISGAPVLDSHDNPIGVVSLADVARHIAERPGEPAHAKDLMSPRFYHVEQDTSVLDILELMLTDGIRRVVVTHRDRVIGIVTATDLMAAFRDTLREG